MVKISLLEKGFNGDDSDSGRANTVALTIKNILCLWPTFLSQKVVFLDLQLFLKFCIKLKMVEVKHLKD